MLREEYQRLKHARQMKRAKPAQDLKLTEGVIWKQLLRFAWPLLLSNLLQQLYSTVDLVIVGNYAGNTALGAVGATGYLTNLFVGFFIGLSTGASVIVSQHYGEENVERLRDSIHSGIALALAGGLLLSVLGIAFTKPILVLMATPLNVLDDAAQYMFIIFCGMLPLLVYNMGAGILRALGDSRRPLYLLVVSAVVNIVLDLLFIKSFGWGVVGAAWATVIAQTAAAVLVVLMLMRLNGGYALHPKDVRFHKREVLAILRIGLPAGLQSVAINFSNVVIQSKINIFGSNAVAGAAAAGRIDGFLYMFCNAFGLSATTFVGQNVGAGKFDRAKHSARVALIMSTIVSLVLSVFFIGLAQPILAAFNDHPEVIEAGSIMVQIVVPWYFIFGVTEVLSGVMRGAGMAVPPMLVTLICFTVVRLIWIAVMLPVRQDIRTVFLSWPVSWVAGAIASLLLFYRANWLKRARANFAERQEELRAEEALREAKLASVLQSSDDPDTLPTKDSAVPSYTVRDEQGQALLYTEDASYLTPEFVRTMHEDYEKKLAAAKEDVVRMSSDLEKLEDLHSETQAVEAVAQSQTAGEVEGEADAASAGEQAAAEETFTSPREAKPEREAEDQALRNESRGEAASDAPDGAPSDDAAESATGAAEPIDRAPESDASSHAAAAQDPDADRDTDTDLDPKHDAGSSGGPTE